MRKGVCLLNSQCLMTCLKCAESSILKQHKEDDLNELGAICIKYVNCISVVDLHLITFFAECFLHYDILLEM